MTDPDAASQLSEGEAEGLALFLAGLQALAIEPIEVLIAAGVLPDTVAARRFRDDPLTRLLDLDGAALVAFWRLVTRIHADRRSGARAD